MELSQIQKRAAMIASDAQALIRELAQLHPALAIEAAQAEAEFAQQAAPSPGSDVAAAAVPSPVEVQNAAVKQLLANIAEAECRAKDVEHEMGWYAPNDRRLATLSGLKKAYEDTAWFLKKQLAEAAGEDPEIVKDGDVFRGSQIKLSSLTIGGFQHLGAKAPIFLLAPVPMEIVVIDGMNQVKEAVYSAEWFYDGAMRKLPYDPLHQESPVDVRVRNAAGEVKWVRDKDVRVMIVVKQPR